MDPTFLRSAHREYFLDGRGRLRLAFCEKGFIGHSPEVSFLLLSFFSDKKIQTCKGAQPEYFKYRYPNKVELEMTSNKLWWFRNYFKCLADF